MHGIGYCKLRKWEIYWANLLCFAAEYFISWYFHEIRCRVTAYPAASAAPHFFPRSFEQICTMCMLNARAHGLTTKKKLNRFLLHCFCFVVYTYFCFYVYITAMLLLLLRICKLNKQIGLKTKREKSVERK